jgi:serine protease Do
MAAMAKKTLYDVLGLARDAMALDVGLAYQKRLDELQRAPVQDASELALVKSAHEVLSNPKRRAAYDASLVTESEKAAAKEQAAPDLVLEAEEDESATRRIPPVGIAIGVVVLIIIAIFAWRTMRTPAAPPKAAEAGEAAAPAPPPPPPVQKKSAKDILAQAQNAVARLQSFEMSGRAVPLGLAVALEPNAVITTCHGIQAGSQLVASFGTETRSAQLIINDELLDLCRLGIAPPAVPTLAVATEEPKVDDPIYVLGANASGELALTEGKVQALMPDARGKMLQVSMPIAANGSGGAVFDAYGRLVGIATTSHGHGASVSLAIPATWIARMRSRPPAQPPAEPAPAQPAAPEPAQK